MVRLASSCAWNVPSRLVKNPCGSFVSASSLADVGDDLRHVGAAVGVGEHDDAPAAVLAQDLVGPVGLPDLGDLPRRDPADGRLDQQIAEALRGATVVRRAASTTSKRR